MSVCTLSDLTIFVIVAFQNKPKVEFELESIKFLTLDHDRAVDDFVLRSLSCLFVCQTRPHRQNFSHELIFRNEQFLRKRLESLWKRTFEGLNFRNPRGTNLQDKCVLLSSPLSRESARRKSTQAVYSRHTPKRS